MGELVTIEDGQIVVSSKDIAERFGKTHRHSLTAIRNLIDGLDADFGETNFRLSEYTSSQNKVLPCYMLTRDGFSLLAMGFTGQAALDWKVKYLKAFNKMEAMLSASTSVMQSLNDAIKLMEEDADVASLCGRGLSAWKEKKRVHIDRVEKLQKEVQLLLNFTGIEK